MLTIRQLLQLVIIFACIFFKFQWTLPIGYSAGKLRKQKSWFIYHQLIFVLYIMQIPALKTILYAHYYAIEHIFEGRVWKWRISIEERDVIHVENWLNCEGMVVQNCVFSMHATNRIIWWNACTVIICRYLHWRLSCMHTTTLLSWSRKLHPLCLLLDPSISSLITYSTNCLN